MRALDWRWLMGVGLGLLRLPPAHFWTMTPRELAAVLKALLGRPETLEPLARQDLVALMARYPDNRTGQDDG